MMLNFAYGSNMSRTAMRERCPHAVALGTAVLDGWCFVICPQGYASIEPRQGDVVHGVLWRLSMRDLASLDAYESLDCGLYVRRVLPVSHGASLRPASIYIAGRRGEGRPLPSYMQDMIEAAREWELPEPYIRSLQRWSPSRWRGAHGKETGIVG